MNPLTSWKRQPVSHEAPPCAKEFPELARTLLRLFPLPPTVPLNPLSQMALSCIKKGVISDNDAANDSLAIELPRGTHWSALFEARYDSIRCQALSQNLTHYCIRHAVSAQEIAIAADRAIDRIDDLPLIIDHVEKLFSGRPRALIRFVEAMQSLDDVDPLHYDRVMNLLLKTADGANRLAVVELVIPWMLTATALPDDLKAHLSELVCEVKREALASGASRILLQLDARGFDLQQDRVEWRVAQVKEVLFPEKNWEMLLKVLPKLIRECPDEMRPFVVQFIAEADRDAFLSFVCADAARPLLEKVSNEIRFVDAVVARAHTFSPFHAQAVSAVLERLIRRFSVVDKLYFPAAERLLKGIEQIGSLSTIMERRVMAFIALADGLSSDPAGKMRLAFLRAGLGCSRPVLLTRQPMTVIESVEDDGEAYALFRKAVSIDASLMPSQAFQERMVMQAIDSEHQTVALCDSLLKSGSGKEIFLPVLVESAKRGHFRVVDKVIHLFDGKESEGSHLALQLFADHLAAKKDVESLVLLIKRTDKAFARALLPIGSKEAIVAALPYIADMRLDDKEKELLGRFADKQLQAGKPVLPAKQLMVVIGKAGRTEQRLQLFIKLFSQSKSVGDKRLAVEALLTAQPTPDLRSVWQMLIAENGFAGVPLERCLTRVVQDFEGAPFAECRPVYAFFLSSYCRQLTRLKGEAYTAHLGKLDTYLTFRDALDRGGEITEEDITLTVAEVAKGGEADKARGVKWLLAHKKQIAALETSLKTDLADIMGRWIADDELPLQLSLELLALIIELDLPGNPFDRLMALSASPNMGRYIDTFAQVLPPSPKRTLQLLNFLRSTEMRRIPYYPMLAWGLITCLRKSHHIAPYDAELLLRKIYFVFLERPEYFHLAILSEFLGEICQHMSTLLNLDLHSLSKLVDHKPQLNAFFDGLCTVKSVMNGNVEHTEFSYKLPKDMVFTRHKSAFIMLMKDLENPRCQVFAGCLLGFLTSTPFAKQFPDVVIGIRYAVTNLTMSEVVCDSLMVLYKIMRDFLAECDEETAGRAARHLQWVHMYLTKRIDTTLAENKQYTWSGNELNHFLGQIEAADGLDWDRVFDVIVASGSLFKDHPVVGYFGLARLLFNLETDLNTKYLHVLLMTRLLDRLIPADDPMDLVIAERFKRYLVRAVLMLHERMLKENHQLPDDLRRMAVEAKNNLINPN